MSKKLLFPLSWLLTLFPFFFPRSPLTELGFHIRCAVSGGTPLDHPDSVPYCFLFRLSLTSRFLLFSRRVGIVPPWTSELDYCPPLLDLTFLSCHLSSSPPPNSVLSSFLHGFCFINVSSLLLGNWAKPEHPGDLFQ